MIKMDIYEKKCQAQILNFWTIDLFWMASMASKMIQPKNYLFIFNFRSVVETLDNSLKPGISVEITFIYFL